MCVCLGHMVDMSRLHLMHGDPTAHTWTDITAQVSLQVTQIYVLFSITNFSWYWLWYTGVFAGSSGKCITAWNSSGFDFWHYREKTTQSKFCCSACHRTGLKAGCCLCRSSMKGLSRRSCASCWRESSFLPVLREALTSMQTVRTVKMADSHSPFTLIWRTLKRCTCARPTHSRAQWEGRCHFNAVKCPVIFQRRWRVKKRKFSPSQTSHECRLWWEHLWRAEPGRPGERLPDTD